MNRAVLACLVVWMCGGVPALAGGAAHDDDDDHEPPTLYPATIMVDPRHIANVVVKINARVASLRNLYVGQRIVRGQVLGELESAELETVQRTYLELVNNMDAVQAFSMTTNEKLIDARMNLAWRGMSEDDIKTIEETKQPLKRIVVKAPEGGYLAALNVVNDQIVNAGGQGGQYTTSGTTIATIAKPEAVYIEAQVPLSDAAGLRPGMRASAVLPGANGTTNRIRATVERVFAYVNPVTQRRRVRLAFAQMPAYLPLADGLPVMVQFEGARRAH